MFFLLSLTAFADTSYVVQKGDTLLKLSDRLLGQPNHPQRYAKMREIVNKNPALGDRNVLTPGERIILPDAPAEVVAAAIAKSPPAPPKKPAPPKVPPLPPAAPKAPAPPDAPIPVAEVPVAPPPELPVTSEDAKLSDKPLPPVPPPPPPVPPPHHAEATHSEHAEGHADFWFVQPRYRMTELEVSDKTTHEHATSESEMNAGLSVGYAKAFGKMSHVVLAAGLDFAKMGGVGHGDMLKDETQTLKSVSLAWERELPFNLELEVKAFYNDMMFLTADGVDTYKIKSIAVPGAEVGLGWAFWQLTNSAVGAAVSAEYAMEVKSAGLTYESVIDPNYAIFWDSEKYRVSLTYGGSEQAPKGYHHEAVNIGLKAQFKFPL